MQTNFGNVVDEYNENGLVRGIYHLKEGEYIPGIIHLDKDECIKGVTYGTEKCIDEIVTVSEEKEEEPRCKITEGQINKDTYMNAPIVTSNPTVDLLSQLFNITTSKAKVMTENYVEKENFQEEFDIPTMFNFKLRLTKNVIFVRDTENGEDYQRYYGVEIAIKKMDGSIRTFITTVPSNKIKAIEWLKDATYSMATLPKSKEERECFEAMVQSCIEDESAKVELIYPRTGWRNIPGTGRRYVLANGVIGNANGIIRTTGEDGTLDVMMSEVGKIETFRKALAMREICPKDAASSELFLYVHASVISTVFEEAGFPITFPFGIVGVTNSRKTSLATTMAQIFNREKLKAHAEFATSTSCGMETVLSRYCDAPVIIDDFKPGINQTQSRNMAKKLDEVVRLCGNRVAKVRMLEFMPDKDKKYFPITSQCVMTMELVTGVTSTISRMFLTNIEIDSVDNSRLLFYQENRWILPTHLYDFISWITLFFDNAITYIRNNFPEYRRKYEFAFDRYADMFATFLVCADIFSRYAIYRKFWTEDEKFEFLKHTEITIHGELCKMSEMARKRDKADVVRRALQDALIKGRIPWTFLDEESAAKKLDCYEDPNKFYIRTDSIRNIINNFCVVNREDIVIGSVDETIDLLEKLGLLEVHETNTRKERARKLPIQKANSLRYLVIPKCDLAKILEE